MGLLSTIISWIHEATAAWCVAGITGGMLILAAERLSRRAEPSDADVRRTAEQYRRWYGERALDAVGDHMLAARFAPDGRHGRFLRRVSAEVVAAALSDGECALEGESTALARPAAPRCSPH